MTVSEFEPLAPRTTLRVGGPARFFTTVQTMEDIARVCSIARAHASRLYVLGSGSNIRCSDDGVSGIVAHIALRGRAYESISDEEVRVSAEAGEIWDTLVAECCAHGLWGLENLSGIPGTVGATPIQNVGAYGAEVSDVIESVEVFDIQNGHVSLLPASACAFSYRDSVFKKAEGASYIITRVTFRLSVTPRPRILYRDLAHVFAHTSPHTPNEVRNAVLNIRAKKFPDLTRTGSAGSFFKNPIVSHDVAVALRARFPDMPMFPQADGRVKLALAWVLDAVLHLNGVREGAVGLFAHQPLVLVTYEGATSTDIDAFAKKIQSRVRDTIDVDIEREVREW